MRTEQSIIDPKEKKKRGVKSAFDYIQQFHTLSIPPAFMKKGVHQPKKKCDRESASVSH